MSWTKHGRPVERSHIAALELKARRFEAESMSFMAQLARMEGDRVTALAHARGALAIARETGIDYIGGMILGELPPRPTTRRAARRNRRGARAAGSRRPGS